MTATLQLEVGKTYRTRNDRLVRIIHQMDSTVFPYIGVHTDSDGSESCLTYQASGRFYLDPKADECGLDLMGEYVPLPVTTGYTLVRADGTFSLLCFDTLELARAAARDLGYPAVADLSTVHMVYA